ncbi:unnamed protein product [Lactuca saligna]|uniref:Uncharacterized protein n=1 Tax=Lactuca saligna TaxID=75948 RepID=A0AA35VAE6_LACSI|nr:unnamed protein product [Lactuca saligna]
MKKLCDTISELASSILPDNVVTIHWGDFNSTYKASSWRVFAVHIAKVDTLEEGTRHLAIEFVITLAEAREKAPGMMRKLPQFIIKFFCILLQMLLDIKDEPAWHTAKNEDNDAGESSNCSVGQEGLDRLSIALSQNTIVPVASEQFSAYLAPLSGRNIMLHLSLLRI